MSDQTEPRDSDGKAQAMQDLRDILALRKTPAFHRYFLRKLELKIAPLAKSVLEDDSLDDMQRNAKRMQLKALREIVTMMDDDEIGNRSILNIEKGAVMTDGIPQ